MGFDFESHLGAVERSVSSLERDGLPAGAVTLARSYATTVEDLWDAVTNGERIPRWFLPVSGDLELGGRYQLEGNAGGVITACERPSHFALTWEFGEDTSWVEVRFSDDGVRRARLTLTHTAHLSEHWGEYGPGAVGVGWELALMGLAIHLTKRPSQCRTKPLSQLHRMVRCSSRAAAMGGRERQSRPERTPTPHVRRQGARPHSTLVNRPSPPDARALSNLRDSKARPMRVRTHGYGTPRLESGGPCRNRTCNLTIKSRLLCLVELMARI